MEQETENLNSSTEETPEATPEQAPEQKSDESKEEFTERERQYYERLKKQEAEIAELKAQIKPTDDFVKKADLAAENESLARQSLNESSNGLDKEIVENWDEIAPLYQKVATRGKNSKEAVIEDLRDAHAIWARNKTPRTASTVEANIAAVKGTQGMPATDTPKPTGPKIIKPSRKMEDWYPAKS